MATILYLRSLPPALWEAGNLQFYSVKDAARAVTVGDDTFTWTSAYTGLSTAIGTGAGSGITVTTVVGPMGGKFFNAIPGWFSPPIAADFTLSGSILFAFCGKESSMSANTTFRAQVYRVDAEGALTLVADGVFGTEIQTSMTRYTFTATPTSTNMKKGDRLLLVPMIDDATSVNMGSGYTITLQGDGDNASLANSYVQFTETITFLVDDPTGTALHLRTQASDLSGEKALSTTSGSDSATATHTTLTGPITFPGDQWTATAGGADISWTSAPLDAFTLGGVVQCVLSTNSVPLEAATDPNDAITVELGVVDADGSNFSVWARSYTSTHSNYGVRYLTGPDKTVAQGKRLRLRLYSDDAWPNAQVAGTNRIVYYGGATTYEAWLKFTQTITEASTGTTVTPGTGAVAATGYAPKLDLAIAIGLGVLSAVGYAPSAVIGIIARVGLGALTATGFAPTVAISNNTTVTTGLGAVTATGYAPTVAISDNKIVATGSGVVSVTGSAPTAHLTIRAFPGVGSVAATGFAPTVQISDNQRALPGAGSAVLSGYAPTVVHGGVAYPGSGVLTITGYAPTVAVTDHKVIVIGVGALTVTGYEPLAGVIVRASPGTGALTVSGFEPTVAITDHQIVLPGVGALSATGYAPSVDITVTGVLIGLGELTVTGYAPTPVATQHIRVLPGTGALAATGFAPTVQLPIRVQVDVGALAVTGYAPTIRVAVSAFPGVGALTITGYAPTVAISNNQRPAPGTGALVVTGYPPTAVTPNTIPIGVGGVVVTGFAPVAFASDTKVVYPGVGALVITGYAPTIITAPAQYRLVGPLTNLRRPVVLTCLARAQTIRNLQRTVTMTNLSTAVTLTREELSDG